MNLLHCSRSHQRYAVPTSSNGGSKHLPIMSDFSCHSNFKRPGAFFAKSLSGSDYEVYCWECVVGGPPLHGSLEVRCLRGRMFPNRDETAPLPVVQARARLLFFSIRSTVWKLSDRP